MNVSERLAASAVVPVVVLDDAKDAVATAKALLCLLYTSPSPRDA